MDDQVARVVEARMKLRERFLHDVEATPSMTNVSPRGNLGRGVVDPFVDYRRYISVEQLEERAGRARNDDHGSVLALDKTFVDRLKEHAWKSKLDSDSEPLRRAATHTRSAT